MTHLFFVGDGERDAATAPAIVRRLLNATFRSTCQRWARLHGAGRGYGRKLLYALRQARDRKADGLVATVDADKEKKGRRLRTLRNARESDRSRFPTFPTALGEAVPHGEAWLLDDPVAVREAMNLPSDTKIPPVPKSSNPKETLHQLLGKSPRAEERPLQVWADIAGRVDASRCRHGKATGFHAFVDDVRRELGPLGNVAPDPR